MRCNKHLYKPLLVGADYNKGEDFYLKDNSSDDNISAKNTNYCELTGMYWIWKNTTDDVIGICHYRRYFSLSSYVFWPLGKFIIERLLQKWDVILPRKNEMQYNGLTAENFFAKKHDPIVWNVCRQVIMEKKPEYVKDFDWFAQEKSGHCFNMCIMNKCLYDRYCDWLFSILFELERRIDITKYNDYNIRMFGFVSERLLNVWIHHQGLTVKECSVFFSEQPPVFMRIYKKIARMRRNFS